VQRWQLEVVTEEMILDYERYNYNKLDWEAFVTQLTEEAFEVKGKECGHPTPDGQVSDEVEGAD
jgi:hypothetical protein